MHHHTQYFLLHNVWFAVNLLSVLHALTENTSTPSFYFLWSSPTVFSFFSFLFLMNPMKSTLCSLCRGFITVCSALIKTAYRAFLTYCTNWWHVLTKYNYSKGNPNFISISTALLLPPTTNVPRLTLKELPIALIKLPDVIKKTEITQQCSHLKN